MTHEISLRLSQQFGIKLTPDVEAWFAQRPWKRPAHTYFDQPIEALDLLDCPSKVIWGGQMLPDTIPFLTDGAGNALCLRFGFDNAVSEVVHWDHEGGSLDHSLTDSETDYLRSFGSENPSRRVRDYWIKCGQEAERADRHDLAYRCYYAAGWDVASTTDIEEILNRLEIAANKAGSSGLSLLAKHHRLSLSH